MLMLWLRDEFPQPVAELGPAFVGQRVDGAFGTLSYP
jgi:hypothetical protein